MYENKEIVFTKHSPYMAINCKLEDAKGEEIETPTVYSLCRCGESSMKPFCDGTHGKIGFDGTPEDTEKPPVQNYENQSVTVHYDPYLCRHAKECVNRCPEVFNPDNHPWINVHEADNKKLMDTIKKCPTGALSFTKANVTHKNYYNDQKIVVEKDGPFNIQGNISLIDDLDSKRHLITEDHYSLCRCGKSKRKPICDSTHNDINFSG